MDRMRSYLGFRRLLLIAAVVAVAVGGAFALAPAKSEACPREGVINCYSNSSRTNLVGSRA